MSPVESPSVATVIFRASRPAIPLWRDNGARWKWGDIYSRKIYDYNSKESPPNIKIIRKPIGLRESR